MTSGIVHIFRRCHEEGLANSCRLVFKRLRYPFIIRWLRWKYRNYKINSPFQKRRYHNNRDRVFFVCDHNMRTMIEIYRKVFRRETEITLSIADKICTHDFKWLCPNCPEFSNGIDWHDSFVDNKRWPLDFYQDLDYSSNSRLGDVRQVWELNRHQYFMTLAKAYLLTGECKYFEEFKKQISDWIEKNPVGYGINWLHSQEVSLRAVAWTWAFYLFRDALNDDDSFRVRFLSSIYAHADFVECHLSDHSVTHNHLVSEACGLAILGLMYPELKRSSKWYKKGVKIFYREVLKQIWEDGLSGELSTNYHCFALDSFLQLYILLLKNGVNVPKEVCVRIERMVEAVMFILRPDGSLPLIGDCDNGRAFKLSEYRMFDRRAYLSIGAVLFGREDFRSVAKGFHEESFWLLGIDGLNTYEQLSNKTPATVDKVFVEGGLAIFRTSWEENSQQLLVRGGPTQLRKGVGTTHNHSDFLSFEFFSKGRSILIDPGVYLYGQDDEWRFFYRKTLAHNTITVDGIDHLDVTLTRFGIPSLHLSTLHKYETDSNQVLLDLSHSGYDAYGLTHRRQFYWQKERFLGVIDHVGIQDTHRVEQYFHFTPDVCLLVEDGRIIAFSASGEKLLTIWSSVNGICLDVDILRGQTKGGIQGWVSEQYGVKKPANVARVVYSGELPIIMVTVLAEGDNPDMATLHGDLINKAKRYSADDY